MTTFSQTHEEKRERVQINKIRNENDSKRLQLHSHKMHNLEEMDKLLDMYNIPRLNQEEIKTTNRPISSNDNELVI